MTQTRTPRTPGAMTAAMSARRAATELPRALRLGVMEDGQLHEQLFRTAGPVRIGRTERATVTLPLADLPEEMEVFTAMGSRWFLCVGPAMDGRVSIRGAITPVAALRGLPGVVVRGDAVLVPLDDDSRGKLTVGAITLLFQFVVPPPIMPKPQLPATLRASLGRNLDWRYNACVAALLTCAAGALGWVEYGWDPDVETDATLADYVARRVQMDPSAVDNPEPVVPPEGAADAPPNGDTATRSPTNNRPSVSRPSVSRPNVTDPTHTATAALAAADRAVAAAGRGFDATFAPLTGMTRGPRAASDLLANNTLMEGTAEDLAHTHGITSQRPGVLAHNGNPTSLRIPGDQRLGRTDLTTPRGEGPTSGNLREPTGPRTVLVSAPDAPEPTGTCEGDPQSVSRVFRQGLSGLRSCYERAVRNDPTLAGRMTLRFTVGESGRVSRANASGLGEAVEGCATQTLRRLVFAPATCGSADYEFSVSFSTGDAH